MEKSLQNKEVMEKLKGFDIPWEKSKEEVWSVLNAQIERKETKVVTMATNRWLRIAAAAVILLAGSGLFMRFYQTSITCPNGEYLTHQLPDGSVVDLNAGSSLQYHPLWWSFSRSVDFEGEGFFTVQKGEKFTVHSDLGSTQVLGTSFSIYSRNDSYAVVCHTGKVSVSVNTGETKNVILHPNESAEYQKDTGLIHTPLADLPAPAKWKSKQMQYTGSPISDVLQEIERQYDVKIDYPSELNQFYTGDLDFNQDILAILHLVCKPFTFTFAQISKGEFKIIE